MRLFKTSSGFVIAFGFDMVRRCPDPRMICWCDPASPTRYWEALSSNQAGSNNLTFDVCPEFIFEHEGRVIAYQPGLCIEMQYVGQPYIWSFRIMRPTPTGVLDREGA